MSKPLIAPRRPEAVGELTASGSQATEAGGERVVVSTVVEVCTGVGSPDAKRDERRRMAV